MKVDNYQLKTRVFICEFVWTEALIQHIIQSCNERGIEICGWGVRSKDIRRLKGVWPDVPIYEVPRPSNLEVINFGSNLVDSFSFDEEESIRFLLDREGGYQNNMHSSQARYEVYGWVENVLKHSKPDWLLFPDVPHNIFTYLLYLCGKRNGVKSLILRRGLAPHLFTLSKTIEREPHPAGAQAGKLELSLQTSEYLKALRYGDEISPTNLVRQRQNSNVRMVVKRSLARGFDLFTKKSMGAALTYLKRRRLKQFYESVCERNLDTTKPYVAIFLHFQPERTTTPEGGAFAQQWLIVQMLSVVCSSIGWNLYVREHPSTFMIGPKLYRGKWFYNSLKALSNVSLVSTSVNSTAILKDAKAIATVTGTVAVEALAKGIPALLFGESPCFGCSGAYRIKSLSDLEAAMVPIKDKVEIKFEDVQRFYSAWEHDENCHNSGLARTADHVARWLKGIPQTVMFSKMVGVIEKEKLTSLNDVR